MLKISLDEAYVFDLLSIYEVKYEKSNSEKSLKINQQIDLLKYEIVCQIGLEKFTNILNSSEYNTLKCANRNVFDLVDIAHTNELSKITADANYERFIKKSELQKKFFNNELMEIKI